MMQETTIDLKIIQRQLDEIETTLLLSWRYLGALSQPHMQEASKQVSHAIDTLLAVKKSFHLSSDLIPVEEQENATSISYVMIPKEWPEKVRDSHE